jgi:hypothetical protein
LLKAMSIASRRKMSVEIFVTANPNPNPNVIFKSLRDRAKITRYTHGPKTWIVSQSF